MIEAPTDLWGHEKAKNLYLVIALCFACVAIAFLAGSAAWERVQGKPVHLVPPGGPGISRPGEIPTSLAIDYAKRWLKDRCNFTPSTVREAHSAILATLYPSQTKQFVFDAEKEARLVKEHKLSSQLVVTQTAVTQRQAERVAVVVDAIRTVWIGSQAVREEVVRAEFLLGIWSAAGVPSGLGPLSVKITPPLSAAGE